MPRLIAVMGPTASGKSTVAEFLADQSGAQLIAADAFTVYRGFDIGTNKPTESRHRYEMIDVVDPEDGFGVGEFIRRCQPILEKCFQIDQDVVVVGGTGLYIRALFEGWSELQPAPDPEIRRLVQNIEFEHGLTGLVEKLHSLDPNVQDKIDLRNNTRVRRALERAMSPQRSLATQIPPFRRIKIGIDVPVPNLDDAIRKRIGVMLQKGWVDEVRSLLESGISESSLAFRAIGYSEIQQVVRQSMTTEMAREEIFFHTRRYAKRQRAWMRSEPGLTWLRVDQPVNLVSSDVAEGLRGITTESD